MSTDSRIGTIGIAIGLGLMALSSHGEPTTEAPSPPALHQESQGVECDSDLDPDDSDIVVEEVEAFLAHYIETLESKNEEAIRDLFVADDRFAWFTDGKRSYSTPEDVLAGMRRYDEVEFKTALSEVHVVPVSAMLASVWSDFRTKLTIPGADDFEYGGVITWLVEKDRNAGTWRVLLGHTSTPGGPPSDGDR